MIHIPFNLQNDFTSLNDDSNFSIQAILKIDWRSEADLRARLRVSYFVKYGETH